MKVKELPMGLQNLLVAHETLFYDTDMTATASDYTEQIEWLLDSDINDIDWLFEHYTEQIER